MTKLHRFVNAHWVTVLGAKEAPRRDYPYRCILLHSDYSGWGTELHKDNYYAYAETLVLHSMYSVFKNNVL